MKKIYSIVLMATALLIGTNVKADDVTVQGNDLTALQAAITAAGNEGTVTLTQPLIITAGTTASWAGIWIGSEDENGTAPKITLDLAGNNITIKSGDYKYKGAQAAQNLCPFVITKGELRVVSDSPASIFVQKGTSALNKNTSVFSVFGTYNKVNPKGTDPFSHLFIGENITVETQNGTGIIIDQLIPSQTAISALATKPGYHTQYYSNRGFAFGALVEVKGKLISQGGTKCYGIKTNGLLACPGDATLTVNTTLPDYMQGLNYTMADTAYAPFVHVYEKAELTSENSYLPSGSAAAYASGYAQWLIEGKCDGANGLYASSGKIEIKGAEITSHTNEYTTPAGTGHADGAGSAIVVNSRDGYAGSIEIEISGDTKVEATSGFAIEECVKTSNEETKVDAITINAGSFQGGTNPSTGESQPAIIVSSQTAGSTEADVVIYGGNIEGPLVVNGDDDKSLNDFLDGDVHTTTIIVDGKNTTVVSAGDAPNKFADIATNAGKSVFWTGNSETLIEDITLAELEINKNDTTWKTSSGKQVVDKITPHEQVLNIGDDTHNVTLIVDRVVLGSAAKVIVNPGSKLIVKGEQGFVAPVAENITLKATEASRAIFLFHPSVTSNRHPSATVEFASKSFVNGSNYASQRFGIPTFGALSSVKAVNSETDENVRTRFYNFDKDANSWISLGYINGNTSDPAFNKSLMADPFAYYQMYNYATTANTKVIMKGQLFGNDSPELAVRGNFWNGFANSYMGPMNILALIDMIPETVQKAIYLYDITSNQTSWEPLNLVDAVETDAIQPMQPFLIRNANDAGMVDVDYGDAVYYTASGSGETKPGASPAPARLRAMDYNAKAKLIVKGENYIDRVTVAERADFSAEFDNGYDAVKYMNEGINMYITADEHMSIFATDNLEDTYVGFQSVKGGEYTIEFANVQGKDLTLVDLETGVQTLMVEGNTYTFNAAANTTNDYRFQIINTNGIMTGIENAEAAKSAKGIYTITGIYVGEMNLWNALPAGVYVVNGEKRVK